MKFFELLDLRNQRHGVNIDYVRLIREIKPRGGSGYTIVSILGTECNYDIETTEPFESILRKFNDAN
jgi:hypothetical protein